MSQSGDSNDHRTSCSFSGHFAFNHIDAVLAAERQGFLPSSESPIVGDGETELEFAMKRDYTPTPWARVFAPFSMKWTLILSTAAFLASTAMAAIDDNPPRLVVWAGTLQFIVTVIVAAIHAWRSPTRDGSRKAKSDVGAEAVATNTARPTSHIRG